MLSILERWHEGVIEVDCEDLPNPAAVTRFYKYLLQNELEDSLHCIIFGPEGIILPVQKKNSNATAIQCDADLLLLLTVYSIMSLISPSAPSFMYLAQYSLVFLSDSPFAFVPNTSNKSLETRCKYYSSPFIRL